MTAPYYADDKVTLYLGDCREVTNWLAADVLVTDPPYGIGWKRHGGGRGSKNRGERHEGIVHDEDATVRDAALDLWGDRPAVVFGSFDAPEPPRRRQTLVWRKWDNSGVLGSTTGFRRDVEPVYLIGSWPSAPTRWSSLLTTSGGVGNIHAPQRKYQHPHAKPLNVMEQLIEACPDGIIADPFAGSGSTLVAARNLGRRAIGVELDEKHCETIARRLAQDCLDLGEAS